MQRQDGEGLNGTLAAGTTFDPNVPSSLAAAIEESSGDLEAEAADADTPSLQEQIEADDDGEPLAIPREMAYHMLPGDLVEVPYATFHSLCLNLDGNLTWD